MIPKIGNPRRWIAWVAVVTAATSAMVWRGSSGRVNGHPLRYWVQQLPMSPMPVGVGGDGEARQVIQSLGADALPALMDMARPRKESSISSWYRQWFHSRAFSVRENLPAPESSPGALRCQAIHAIGLLGPSARPAIPVLMDAIRRELHSPIGMASSGAMWSLAQIGPEAREALPILERVVRGGFLTRWPKDDAFAAISQIDPDYVVPMLCRCLRVRDPDVRRWACNKLSHIGTLDRKAEASVIEYLESPDISPEESRNLRRALLRKLRQVVPGGPDAETLEHPMF